VGGGREGAGEIETGSQPEPEDAQPEENPRIRVTAGSIDRRHDLGHDLGHDPSYDPSHD
jgi:hypothetical protein